MGAPAAFSNKMQTNSRNNIFTIKQERDKVPLFF